MSKNILNINHLVQQGEESYMNMLKSMENLLLKDYSSRKNKLTVEYNNCIKDHYLSHVYIQTILLYPFVKTEGYEEITDDIFIFDQLSNFTGDVLSNYMDTVMIQLEDYDKSIINNSIAFIIETLSDVSGYFNIYNGTTINLYDLAVLSDKHERFNELLHYNIEDQLQFNDIEKEIDEKYEEAEKILKEEDICYSDYLNSESGMNPRQLREVIINIGNKPDLSGNIIPLPINTNFIRGLNYVYEFFILGEGSKKALINNHSQVTESGYLTRKLSLLNIDTYSNWDNEDCGSTEYLKIKITNKDMLSRYKKRYYLNDDGNLELINPKTHENLIGKTINVRSPISCKSEDGNICRTCYGRLLNINKDIHTGLIGVLFLTEQLTQRLLATKHLLQSDTDKIEWCDNFNKYFTVDLNNIYLTKRVRGMRMLIDPNDLDHDPQNKPYIDKFYIKRGSNEIKIESPVKLYISQYISDIILDSVDRDYLNRYNIKITDHSEDIPVFTFIAENNEITESLHQIIKLIETNDMLGLSDNIHDVANKFFELLQESNITIDAVHIESILRNMTRDPNDITKLSNKIENEEDYELLRVTSALINSESPSLGLSFENQKNQLQNPHIYYKKGKSVIDYFYKV